MPEDESDAEASRDQPKASRRKEWRDKISRKVSKAVRSAEKPSPEVHNDVADFLQGSGNPAGLVPARKDLAPVTLTPALNPSPSDGLLALSQISRPSTAQSSHFQSVQVLTARQRERRALKLHVQFTTADPDIIGEGGDEAELPSREVTTGWHAANRALQPGLLIDLSNPDDEAKDNVDQADSRNISQELFLPESLQTRPVDRKSTRLDRKPVSLTGIGGPQVADENADRLSRWSKLPGTPAKDVFNLKGTEPRHESGLTEVTYSHNSSIDSTGLANKTQEDLIKPFPLATITAQTDEYVANQPIHEIPSNLHQLRGNGQSRRPVPPPPFPPVAPSATAGNIDRERIRPPSSIELAVDHFYANVQHLNNVFRLAAETYQSPTETIFADWIRACVWWFLKGSDRLEMTSLTEGHSPNSVMSSPDGSALALKQAYIDLAKAWWIMNEVLPRYIQQENPNTQYSGGDEYLRLLEVYSGIQASMRGLSTMMEKRQLLPPSSLLIQGADTRIWIQYPTLSANLGSILTNLTPRKLLKQSPSEFRFFGIPLVDTSMHFTFGKMFVDAEIVSNNDDTDPAEAFQLPCILSIIRKRNSPEVEFTLVSQDNSINLHVQSDKKFGPTWSEIEWRKKSHTLRIRVARDLELVLRFWEKDFRVLFGIYEYACKLQYYWEPYPDEKLKFDKVVRTFHYIGQPQNSMMFPTDPIRQCKIRVFQKIFVTGDHYGKHRLFAGHRMVVFTPPGIKTSSHINQDFRQKDPLMFKYLRGEAEAPALMLDIRDKESYAMVITFDSASARAELHSVLAGTFVYPDEVVSERFPLSKFVISGEPMDQLQSAESLLPIKGIQWQDLQVINKASDPAKDGSGFSQHLRVCLSCNYGTLTDRLNLGMLDYSFLVRKLIGTSSWRSSTWPRPHRVDSDENPPSSTGKSYSFFCPECATSWWPRYDNALARKLAVISLTSYPSVS